MRQLAVVVFELDGVQGFNCVRRLLMQDLATLLQHRAVRDFLGERMLENIFDLRKRWLLVENSLRWREGGDTLSIG
jgi:hypothetical protein